MNGLQFFMVYREFYSDMFLLVLVVGGAGRRVSELGTKKRACVYMCVSECDGPALFLGCVAQSVPSSICPFPSYSASLPFSPFSPFFLLYKTHETADRTTTRRTCVCVRKRLSRSVTSVDMSFITFSICLRPDAHRRTNK